MIKHPLTVYHSQPAHTHRLAEAALAGARTDVQAQTVVKLGIR